MDLHHLLLCRSPGALRSTPISRHFLSPSSCLKSANRFTSHCGKPFRPLAIKYTLINSPPLGAAAIDNADPCSYSRQKMLGVPARCPRFSSLLSWDAAGNWHSDLRSIDRSPPLRHPST